MRENTMRKIEEDMLYKSNENRTKRIRENMRETAVMREHAKGIGFLFLAVMAALVLSAWLQPSKLLDLILIRIFT